MRTLRSLLSTKNHVSRTVRGFMMASVLIHLRKWWGLVVLVGIALAVVLKLPATFCAVQIGYLQLICPVGFIETSIATKSIIVKMLPGVFIVGVLCVFTGRSYCSWICPARYAGNGAKSIALNKMPRVTAAILNVWSRMRNRVQKHIVLTAGDGLAILAGLIIGISLFSFPAYTLFCPVGVLSRNLIELITHLHLRFDLIFLVIPLTLGMAFKTGWKCACPMGLVRGLAATTNKTLQPVIDYNDCILCGKCMQNCAFGVNLHVETFDSFSCSKCLNCLRDCDHSAIELKFLNLPTSEDKQKQAALKAALELGQKNSCPLNSGVTANARRKHS